MLNLMLAALAPVEVECCHPAYHELGAHGPSCERDA